MDFLNLFNFALLFATFRVATPLIFASMGGLVSERAGVINIALEGFMLVGAFSSAVAALHLHSPWIGLLFGMFCAGILAALYALFVIQFKANQIVAGMAINLIASGIPPFVGNLLYHLTGNTPNLPVEGRFTFEPLFLAWVLVFGVALWYSKISSGLWVRFAGEIPEALEATGVSARKVRWSAVIASGALAGAGGASLSLYLSSSFSREMTAGRGFIALAALIFGRWKPLPTAAVCLFFGFADAIQIRLQSLELAGTKIPVQFIQILPYLVTILVLAGFVAKSHPPKSLGQNLEH
ncbi:MAG: ABC transporter permease [Pseudobdellovibrionaceae bacterium]